MRIKSDFIWAALLIGTAAISIYLGARTGALETKENLSNEIEEKDKKIRVLEDKIQQLSDELTSRGIFSYPQANLVSETGDSGSKVLITLNGREQIRDLEIERRIIKDYSGDPQKVPEELQTKGTTVHIGNLNSHNPVAFEIGDFEKELAIDLTFSSKKNQWHQYIVARKTPNGEVKTFWILTNRNSEVIDKHVDEGFPVEEKGFLPFGGNNETDYSDIRMNSLFNPYTYLQQAEKS